MGILGAWHGRVGASLALIMMLGAGCLGGSTSNDEDGQQDLFGASTGALRGSVLDETGLPIAAAMLELPKAGKTTLSKDDGSFQFAHLAPGPYVVRAAAERFHTAEVDVAIVAAEITTVTLHLDSAPSSTAYHETLIADGMIGCSTSFRRPVVGTTNETIQPCDVARRIAGDDVVPSDVDRSFTRFTVGDLGGVTGLWGETQWTGNQYMSGGMQISYSYSMDDLDANLAVFGRLAGGSPVSGVLDLGRLHDNMEQRPSPFCTWEDCQVTAHHTSNPDPNAPVDLGLMFQQQYTDYFTVFRGGPPPTAFTSIPDQ